VPNSRDSANQDTTAGRARKIAERISQISHEVIRSFQCSDPNERLTNLQRVANEISFGMLPVISWLERRRPADAAETVKRRMHLVLDEAIICASLEIPEYEGGTVRRVSEEPSKGAQRTAELSVVAKVFAATLADWAQEIEAEDQKQTPPVPWEGDDDWDALDTQVRRLLRYMNGRDKADLCDLCPKVWEKDYSYVSEAALNTTVSKANHFLRKRESSRLLSKVRGEARLRWK
jgi:hypothetical protein